MKSSYVAATAQLSLSRLTVKSACPPLALPFPRSLFTLSGSRQYYPMQHHPTSTRDRFTGLRRCYFQALTLYIYVLRILYEAWSPVRQRVAVANAFNRQRYNNTISIVIFHFLPVMCARVSTLFLSVLLWPKRFGTRFGLRAMLLLCDIFPFRCCEKYFSRNV